jgi:hypothetical protein
MIVSAPGAGRGFQRGRNRLPCVTILEEPSLCHSCQTPIDDRAAQVCMKPRIGAASSPRQANSASNSTTGLVLAANTPIDREPGRNICILNRRAICSLTVG